MKRFAAKFDYNLKRDAAHFTLGAGCRAFYIVSGVPLSLHRKRVASQARIWYSVVIVGAFAASLLKLV